MSRQNLQIFFERLEQSKQPCPLLLPVKTAARDCKYVLILGWLLCPGMAHCIGVMVARDTGVQGEDRSPGVPRCRLECHQPCPWELHAQPAGLPLYGCSGHLCKASGLPDRARRFHLKCQVPLLFVWRIVESGRSTLMDLWGSFRGQALGVSVSDCAGSVFVSETGESCSSLQR